jgi:hypothetical protein
MGLRGPPANDEGSRANSYSRKVVASCKQAVSIRMSRNDVRNIKRLAERLGARESDVIRFAIKVMLSKLSPLQDPSVRGRSLVPVFLESGPDLMRHFELDSATLDAIINEGVEEGRRVELDDIQLIAASGMQRSYIDLRVAGSRHAHSAGGANGQGIGGQNGNGNGQSAADANGHDIGGQNGNGNGQSAAGEDPFEHSLRQYLYEKYLFAKTSSLASSHGGGR